MVSQHFRLSAQPFGVTPDERFLYLSPTHREAIASLLYGIQSSRGFTALIALPGMGKTTVLRHVLGLLAGHARTAFLFQTLCGPEQFLRSILADLGVDDSGGDLAQMHAKLNTYLVGESKAGRQVVLVIDEAQNLDEPVLELVRMLSNFETAGKKLMHLILCGQPQLAQKLASERLTQLRQRISIIARLAPFAEDETREYIDHRLRVAGASPENAIFSRQAHGMIAKQSGGIPRNINNLCFNAMSLACALKKRQVDASMVRETVDDLDLSMLGCESNDSVSSGARTPVLAMPPGLSRSGAWRYSSGIAAALLVALGLLAFNRTPMDWMLRERPAASLPTREAMGTPESIPAQKTTAREPANEQVAQSAGQPQTDRLPATPSSGPAVTVRDIPRQQGQAEIPKHDPIAAHRRAQASGLTLERPEIRLLPEDVERLQRAGLSERSPNHQDAANNNATTKHDQVPEASPQREKR
jgi:general secretion pathway protein A